MSEFNCYAIADDTCAIEIVDCLRYTTDSLPKEIKLCNNALGYTSDNTFLILDGVDPFKLQDHSILVTYNNETLCFLSSQFQRKQSRFMIDPKGKVFMCEQHYRLATPVTPDDNFAMRDEDKILQSKVALHYFTFFSETNMTALKSMMSIIDNPPSKYSGVHIDEVGDEDNYCLVNRTNSVMYPNMYNILAKQGKITHTALMLVIHKTLLEDLSLAFSDLLIGVMYRDMTKNTQDIIERLGEQRKLERELGDAITKTTDICISLRGKDIVFHSAIFEFYCEADAHRALKLLMDLKSPVLIENIILFLYGFDHEESFYRLAKSRNDFHIVCKLLYYICSTKLWEQLAQMFIYQASKFIDCNEEVMLFDTFAQWIIERIENNQGISALYYSVACQIHITRKLKKNRVCYGCRDGILNQDGHNKYCTGMF